MRRPWLYRLWCGIVLLACISIVMIAGLKIERRALAAERIEHYTVALLIRSLIEEDGSLSPGVQAIVDLAEKRVEEINRPKGDNPGGINGIPLRLNVLNDQADEASLIGLVDTALQDKSLIAIYGLVSPTRGHKVINAIGKRGVPFISEIADDSLFANFPNIFSMQTSAADDARAYTQFLIDNHKSTIFVGSKNDVGARRFEEALKAIGNRMNIMSEHWLPGRNTPDYQTALEAVIADIKLRQPEIISLSAGTSGNADLLAKLATAGIEKPLFFLNGSIAQARSSLGNNIYFGDLYELSRSIPDVVSGKLVQKLREPGYSDLQALSDTAAERTLNYTDILSIISEAAKSASRVLTPSQMRNHIGSALLDYQPGRRVFYGLSRDWSFTLSRSRSQITLINWWLKGADQPVLWKVQYKPEEGGVTQIPVSYFSIDMVRIVEVDSNKKYFNAEFYASIASHQNVGLDRFEFGNAIRSEDDASPLVHTRQIAGNLPAVHSRGSRRLYKISGRFRFDPDLTRYPFDQQPFPIIVQARESTLPVFVQPPPYHLRDKNISIEGWQLLEGEQNNYVGFDTNAITLADKHMSNQEVVHFYRYSFTWIAERLSLNYYLRVIMPLFLILLVSYMSIFAPHTRIESVIAIQVTALLATIALYFSIPKFDSEIATLSDQIFVFTEAVIVFMILSSILRSMMNGRYVVLSTRFIMMLQAVIVPLVCYVMLRYVLIVKANTGVVFSGKSTMETIKLLMGAG